MFFCYTLADKTEKEMIFIYPDMKTVLIGQFENGLLMQGKPAKIVAERCNDGIKEIKVSAIIPDSPTFKYSRPNRIHIGDQPTKVDPYESRYVYIKETRWGDDGVFAKKEIEKDDIVAYYSGMRFNGSEMELFPANQTGYDV